MAEEQLRQLREKLELQQNQFQNYRDQCKQLENFLEEESSKKELEIRQLKEEMITRQKAFKLLKAENAQLHAEVANVKAELASRPAVTPPEPSQIKALETDLADKNSQIQQLRQQLAIITRQSEESLRNQEKAAQQRQESQEKVRRLNQEVANLTGALRDKASEVDELVQQNRQLQEKMTKYKQRLLDSPKKVRKVESSHRELDLERERGKNDEKLRKYEAKIERLERIIKQLKLRASQTKLISSPEKAKEQHDSPANQVKVFTACLIITKPYYLSPFLEVNLETRTLKLFKSSRHGCFEKSLGASRHRFDAVSYEQDQLVANIASRIEEFEEDCPHFILLFGPKKTSKRVIMAAIISKLLGHLRRRVEEYQQCDMSALFIAKYSEDQHGDQREQAFSIEDVLSLLERMGKAPSSPFKKAEKGMQARKGGDIPVITYFCLRLGEFCLEIATSSLTNIPIRQKDLIATFYNNILYSKLPDVLQASYGQKYIVLSLNPIVDLYEDCKNILSITQHRMLYLDNKPEESKERESPNKEMLNALARRKLQQYEKELQQNSLKIRKIQDECFYYKLKFDELEQRLKNLISTHHAQNSYLKKSPILLSYEKMLKFVHSVQAKSSQGCENGNSPVQFNELDFSDDVSLDAL